MISQWPEIGARSPEPARVHHTPRIVSVGELRLVDRPCPACAAPVSWFTLDPISPRDPGTADRLSPRLPESALPYLDNPGRLCRPCSIRREVARMFPEIAPAVDDPLRRAIVGLRVAAPEPLVRPMPIGALFDAGEVHVSPAVLELVAAVARREAGYSEVIRYVDELIDRHQAGDFGVHGRMPVKVPDRDRDLGPLAPIIERNALACLDGSGSVLSEFAISPKRPTIRLWTELAPRPLTLVYLAGDAVRMD